MMPQTCPAPAGWGTQPCGRIIEQVKAGRPRVYCSDACRQAAWAQRKYEAARDAERKAFTAKQLRAERTITVTLPTSIPADLIGTIDRIHELSHAQALELLDLLADFRQPAGRATELAGQMDLYH